MASRSQISRLLEDARNRKGLSGQKLAKKAGLSVNYVRTIERDERHPRWAQFEKLVRALDLTPEEEAEFYRAWRSSPAPEEVEEVLAGPAIPGLVLWKHFPEALYAMEHELEWIHPLVQDMAFHHTVTSCGAFLSLVALRRNPPGENICQDLRFSVERILEDPQYKDVIAYPFMKEQIMGNALPFLWRTHILGDKRRTERLTRLLSRWSYSAENYGEHGGTISLQLRDRALNEQWGVAAADPGDVVSWHDAMTTHLLWESLGLDKDFGSLPQTWYRARCRSASMVVESMKMSPKDIHDLVVNATYEFAPSLASDMLHRRAHQISFATRALNIPRFQEVIFSQLPGLTRDQMHEKAQRLMSLAEAISNPAGKPPEAHG